jgi:hypothetical protein
VGRQMQKLKNPKTMMIVRTPNIWLLQFWI